MTLTMKKYLWPLGLFATLLGAGAGWFQMKQEFAHRSHAWIKPVQSMEEDRNSDRDGGFLVQHALSRVTNPGDESNGSEFVDQVSIRRVGAKDTRIHPTGDLQLLVKNNSDTPLETVTVSIHSAHSNDTLLLRQLGPGNEKVLVLPGLKPASKANFKVLEVSTEAPGRQSLL
jgi:hypothetical protein